MTTIVLVGAAIITVLLVVLRNRTWTPDAVLGHWGAGDSVSGDDGLRELKRVLEGAGVQQALANDFKIAHHSAILAITAGYLGLAGLCVCLVEVFRSGVPGALALVKGFVGGLTAIVSGIILSSAERRVRRTSRLVDMYIGVAMWKAGAAVSEYLERKHGISAWNDGERHKDSGQ